MYECLVDGAKLESTNVEGAKTRSEQWGRAVERSSGEEQWGGEWGGAVKR
jgi:hypothetical protein